MKKVNLLLLMVLVVLSAFSQNEGLYKARQTADRFLSQQNGFMQINDTTNSIKANSLNHSLELTYEVQEAGKSLLYVFSSEEQSEFAIVVADKSEPIVVGYSTNQAFDKDNIIPPVKEFMEAYANMAKEGKVIRNANVTEKAAIYPLIKTKWSQNAPYNQDCPDEKPVGCGPLAMGQIMKYYEYPTRGYGEHGGINFAEQTYDFSKIISGHVSGFGAFEVAKLLHHAGVAADANYYYPNGTGVNNGDLLNAMKQYFGYSNSAKMKMRNEIHDSDWDALVYNELANKRPVIYSGNPPKGVGHIFIVDGYNDGYYHVNWGWGGRLDGNYLLTSLRDYNYAQSASIGLAPERWIPAEDPENDLLAIGFCDNSIAVFDHPYGEDEEYFASSLFPYSHIIPYVGKKVIGVQIGLAEDVTGLMFWLSSGKNEEPFYSKWVGSGHVGWNTILFDIPQTIPANDIYYGYYFDEKLGSHPVGKTADNPGKAMYIRDNILPHIGVQGHWALTDYDCGALSFRLILAEDTEMPADLRLLQMEPVRVLSDSHIKVSGIIENTSGRAISNYTLKYRIDDLPEESYLINQPLKKDERTFFSLEIDKKLDSGIHSLRLWVAEVDGQPDAVIDNSNYYVTTPLLFNINDKYLRTHVVFAEVDYYCPWCSVYENKREEVEQYGIYDCIYINHHIQNMGPDPMANCVGTKESGYTPKVYVNGIYHDNYTDLADLISTYPPTSLAKIEGNATFAADRKQIIVNIETEFAYKGENNFYIKYVLIEDNVGPFNETGDLIFQHVARGIYKTSVGVICTPFSPDHPQECNFAIPLSDNIQNYENLHVVAMLINAITNEVVNAVDMSITYEEAPCFALDKTNLSLLCDVTEKLNVIDSEVPNASAKDYVFTSSDENIVKILEDGYIRAMCSGVATITCKQKNGSNSAQCEVTVRDWDNEVTVTTPGTLRDLVELYDYSELKINGSLDDKDFEYTRVLSGVDVDGQKGTVRHINLKDAKLVNDVIPKSAFSDSPLITLICPSTLKEIREYATPHNNIITSFNSSLQYVTLYEGLEKLSHKAFDALDINSIYLPSTLSSIDAPIYCSSLDYCWVDSKSPYYFAYNNDIYTKDTKALVHYSNSGRYKLILPDWCTEIKGNLTSTDEGTIEFVGRGITNVSFMIPYVWKRAELGPYVKSVNGLFAMYARHLKEIVMPPLTPPTVDGEFNIGIDPQQCALYVNPESIELYKAHPIWSKFFILPMNEEMLNEMRPYYTGIKEVRKDVIESNKVYDLSGRQITQGNNQRKSVLIKSGKKFIK